MSGQETIVGGWTKYHDLSPEDKEVFHEAMKGFVGVDYTPKLVSTQVVAGVNYRYKCDASIPPAQVVWEAIVEIFRPLDGNPIITQIHRI